MVPSICWHGGNRTPSSTSIEEFAATYRRLLESAQERFAPRLILMGPFVLPVTGERKRWGAEDLDAKREVVAALTEDFGAGFVPLQAVLQDTADQNSSPGRGTGRSRCCSRRTPVV